MQQLLYYKMQQKFISKRFSFLNKKCRIYYKTAAILPQNATVITKSDVYYKILAFNY